MFRMVSVTPFNRCAVNEHEFAAAIIRADLQAATLRQF